MKILGNILATIYFSIFHLWIVVLGLPIISIQLYSNIFTAISSGFSFPYSLLWKLIVTISFAITVSSLPPFRNIYKFFPWMMVFTKVAYGTMLINTMTLTLINFLYERQNSILHFIGNIVIFFIFIFTRYILAKIAYNTTLVNFSKEEEQ